MYTACTTSEACGSDVVCVLYNLRNHIAHQGALWNLLGITGYRIQDMYMVIHDLRGLWRCPSICDLKNHIAHPGVRRNLLCIQHARLPRPVAVTLYVYFDLPIHIAQPGVLWLLLGIQDTAYTVIQ